MLVLLPPSESKASRARGAAPRPQTWSFPALTAARSSVARALAAVSARDEAAEVLGVGASLRQEVAANTRLATAPAVAVRDLYTGVLYEALGLRTLGAESSRRASRRLVVVSALYGALRPWDRVAPYRLSMGVNLPGVGPLASFWRPQLDAVLPQAAGAGLVVDCRSSTYAAAWVPRDALAQRWVAVRVPGATHSAKHARGLVARALCEEPVEPRGPRALAELLSGSFRVELHQPARAGRSWVLEVGALRAGARLSP